MKRYDWVGPLLERISDLIRMPHFNNCCGTPAADISCAWTALALLTKVSQGRLPDPIVMPLKSGGLEFSWKGTNTECVLLVVPEEVVNKVSVSLVSGGHPVVQGENATAEEVLSEALLEIAMEVSQEEPKKEEQVPHAQ